MVNDTAFAQVTDDRDETLDTHNTHIAYFWFVKCR